mmetsp:Transcript_9815/g.23101  ORF Transcript_9815/g.23101 Transcript_9815/m.23101 type:complete len:170 (-) Transcript_9815:757-1266(-)
MAAKCSSSRRMASTSKTFLERSSGPRFPACGGRADIMVRCPTPSTTHRVHGLNVWNADTGSYDDSQTIAFIQTRGADTAETTSDLEAWSPPTYPAYLEDLTTKTVTEGCKCVTRFNRIEDHYDGQDPFYGVNGYPFGTDDHGPSINWPPHDSSRCWEESFKVFDVEDSG